MSSEGKTKGPIRRWISAHCHGVTFAEVGGMWGVTNERVSAAHEAGASSVTMIDMYGKGSPIWEKFNTHIASRGLPPDQLSYVQADVEKANFRGRFESRFDYVNCAGVLYHVPNPVNAIHNLAKISDRHLAIATQVLPPRIENSHGSITVEPGAALLIPALNALQKRVLATFYDSHNYKVTNINRGDEAYVNADGTFNYGPSFWLPSIECIIGCVEMFGFQHAETEWLSAHGAAMLFERVRGTGA